MKTTSLLLVTTLLSTLVACSSSSSTGVGADSGTDAKTVADAKKPADSKAPVDSHVADAKKPSDTGTAGDTSTPGDTGTPVDSGTDASDAGGNPPMPTLGTTQLDRVGRPAVNTALNHGFDGNAMTAGAAKDAYNVDSNPADWGTNYTTQFESNLGIIDALDGVCGNQLGYGSPASATSYGLLGGALAADVLYVNTAGTTCTTYLAVEANALGVLTNTDCGGRGPAYNVMDETYSVLAIGAFTGVSNGITTNNVPFLTSFPYLAAPN